MAIREYRDGEGTQWRVWETIPQSGRAARRNVLDDEYRHGWLTFESGAVRRRLAPYPLNWESLPEGELERLCDAARPVPPRSAVETPTTRRRAEAEAEALERAAERARARAEAEVAEDPVVSDAHERGPVRAFAARGARWIAAVHRLRATDELAERQVLRFVGPGLVMDLESFPDDWQRLTDAQLADLFERAEPSRSGGAPESTTRPRGGETAD